MIYYAKNMLHRYSVRYLERDGYSATRFFFAGNKAEARRLAEENGCNDIMKVRRAGFPFAALTVWACILLAAGAFVYLAVRR